ncbi:MAG: cation diffusion facilitator family transporter [Bacteroidia bacterium]
MSEKAIKITRFSLIANIFLAIVKWAVGYFGNSYALIADAIESTSDIFASLMVLIGIKYASRPADENHPYGHGKAEPLITFLIVGFLITSATVITYQSIQNIRTPHESPKAYTLVVLGIIIILKEGFYRLVEKKSRETHSSVLKADAWHHRSDAITSLAAFIGIAIALFGGEAYATADDWAALLAAAIILYNSYLIFRPALGEIMDEHLYEDLVDDIRKISKQVDGVIDTEKCHIRKTGFSYYVDLHAIVSAKITVKAGHDIAHQLKDKLKEELPQLANILIHIEPDEE